MTFRTIKEKDDNHKVETDLFSHWGEKKIKLLDKFIAWNQTVRAVKKISKSLSDLEKI